MSLDRLRTQATLSGLSFFHQLRNLLPRGPIWEHLLGREVESWQDNPPGEEPYDDNPPGETEYQDTVFVPATERSTRFAQFLRSFATEMHNFYLRYITLQNETIPGLSVELLTDWESVAGIPDEITPLAPTQEERQAVVHQKITQGKGDPNLVEMTMSEAYYISYAAGMGYTITISAGGASFRVGDQVGGRLASISEAFTWIVSGNYDATLQGIFEKLKPAHTIIVWA